MGQISSIRISERIRNTRAENKWSAVPEYLAEIYYNIGFYIADVMANIHTNHLRTITEAIETTEYSHNFKRKDGRRLSELRLQLS
jgi:hypothetical protein